MKSDRRSFLLKGVSLAGACTIVALPGCSAKGSRIAAKPDLPEGVNFAPENKHTPRCTIWRDQDDYVLEVLVNHVVHADHHITGVWVVGPGPAHKEVVVSQKTEAEIAKAPTDQWQHLFRFPRNKVPAGADHLVVYSLCNKHGKHGMDEPV